MLIRTMEHLAVLAKAIRARCRAVELSEVAKGTAVKATVVSKMLELSEAKVSAWPKMPKPGKTPLQTMTRHEAKAVLGRRAVANLPIVARATRKASRAAESPPRCGQMRRIGRSQRQRLQRRASRNLLVLAL
jgi:hypothetical protein